MNRAARRRKQKEARKAPTYNMNQAQVKELVNKEMQQQLDEVKQLSISMTTSSLTAAFIIALHDEFGFGVKRLERVLEKVELQFECIETGTVTIEDLVQWCYDYGIDIQGGGRKK